MTTQIRVANVDIVLCKKDGRKHYGLAALGTMPAGTKFQFIRGSGEPGSLGSHVSVDDSGGSVSEEVALVVERNSSEVEATTFDDCAVTVVGHSGKSVAEDFVDHLLRAGRLSITEVKETLAAMFQDS